MKEGRECCSFRPFRISTARSRPSCSSFAVHLSIPAVDLASCLPLPLSPLSPSLPLSISLSSPSISYSTYELPLLPSTHPPVLYYDEAISWSLPRRRCSTAIQFSAGRGVIKPTSGSHATFRRPLPPQPSPFPYLPPIEWRACVRLTYTHTSPPPRVGQTC